MLAARAPKQDTLLELVSTCTGLSRMGSTAGQHVYVAENILTDRRTEVHVARMSPCPAKKLNSALELLETVTAVHNQRQFEIESIGGVVLGEDFDDWLVQARGVGFEDEEGT